MTDISTVKNTVSVLQQAARALSSVCDGASTLDGHGFNGRDTNFGKSIAAQERWSVKQTLAAQKMLKTYRKQLLASGIDLQILPEITAEDLEKMNSDKPKRQPINKVSLNGDFLEFWFDYDPTQKDYVKMTLGCRFVFDDPRGKFWRRERSLITLETLKRYAERYNPLIDDSVYQAYGVSASVPVQDQTADLSMALDADISDLDMTGFQITPFPFQNAGIKYGATKKRAIIGDDMGLGKTFQALGAFHAAKVRRFIVVSPASVKIGWQRSIVKANPTLTSSIWNGKAGREDVNVIIINYDNLVKHIAKLKRFGAQGIIFDEVHYLKSEKAGRTKAAHDLAEGTEFILCLTGTPILNRPVELLSPLKMLGVINQFGGWFSFVKRYCGAFQKTIFVRPKGGGKAFPKKVWDFTGATNQTELFNRLRDVCMIRRRKVDVLTELPAKTRTEIVCSIDNRERYDEAVKDVAEYLAAEAEEDQAFKDEIKDLPQSEQRQLIAERRSEASEAAKAAEHLVLIETLKQIACRGKMAATIDWINDFLETGEKLVIFAVHIEAQDDLLIAFPNAARIYGSDSAETRQKNVDRFRSDPDCNLIVASLAAGGTGIDGLQEVCSNIAFLEMAWTPATMLQGEDRVYRIGQENPVTVYYFVAEDTIDETIQAMLAKKQAVCDTVLDGAEERSGSIFNELMSALDLSGTPDKKRGRK